MRPLCKVIIVDDEMLVRQGIKHLLDWEREGYSIIGEAASGSEALELVEKLHPDIIMTDIVMPVMGGEEFVRIVKEKHPQIEVIVLSSFSEFHYVRSTFQSGVADYILKPKLEADTLLNVLNKTVEKIPRLRGLPGAGDNAAAAGRFERAVESLLAGYEAEIDPALLAAKLPYGRYMWFGAELNHLKDKGNRERFTENIESEFARLGLEKAACIPVRHSPERSLYLVNGDPEHWDDLLLGLRQLASLLPQGKEGYAHFVISRSFSRFGQLGEVYRDNYLKLARYSFYLPERKLIEHGHLPGPPAAYGEFDMAELTELLKRRQFRKAFDGFLEYIDLRSADYRSDIFEFKSLLGNFIFNVTTALGKLNFDAGKLEEAKYGYFRKIDEALYARDAVAVAEEFLMIAERVIGEADVTANPNVRALLRYIEEHYAEPITLSEAAKRFHFNASYLSSYFTAHNHEGFSEYLSKVRVEKAKELLMTTDAAIAEIGEKVGYADQSYFTKVFKKLTGVSPSSYRRQGPAGMGES
ncbi:response regulator transcription factor [Paenibacillus sp. M1]|uniref:Response regulator transcription factor n=1 Tax=Paenibacillus haidiansis TaxID=1574488 RepID=A0ABU7VW32_9BACL